MIKYIKKLIKKQIFLKEHKRRIESLGIRMCSTKYPGEIILHSTERFYERRCYNRLKKL